VKILIVHNYYGSSAPSGENIVVDEEFNLLKRNEHNVDIYSSHSDNILNTGIIGKLIGGISTIYNPVSAYKLSRYVDKYKPDIVHVHNTFPLISNSIFSAIAAKTTVVLTLHNYRLICPAAIPLRNGRVCTLCIDSKNPFYSLKYRCYKNSIITTLPLALNVYKNHKFGTWSKYVHAFIAFTEFQKNILANGGLPKDKIMIKPNFYSGNPEYLDLENRKNQIVYVGRLSEEKGVGSLIKAWKILGTNAPKLIIVGEGPLFADYKELSINTNIEFTGKLPPKLAHEIIKNSKLLILPSECFEGFPMVIREAFAYGTPVAVSDIGPLPSIVKHGQNGVVFKTSDISAIVNVIKNTFYDNISLRNMSIGARKSFDELYNEKTNHKILLNIYETAINNKKRNP
jgi:glycosyltransferase involved in cell wall biosynthesis